MSDTATHTFSSIDELVLLVADELLASDLHRTLLHLGLASPLWKDPVKDRLEKAKDYYRSATPESGSSWTSSQRMLVKTIDPPLRDLSIDCSANVRCRGVECHGPYHQLAYTLDCLSQYPATELLTVAVGGGVDGRFHTCRHHQPIVVEPEETYTRLTEVKVKAAYAATPVMPWLASELLCGTALPSLRALEISVSTDSGDLDSVRSGQFLDRLLLVNDLDEMVAERHVILTLRICYDGGDDDWTHVVAVDMINDCARDVTLDSTVLCIELAMNCETYRESGGLKIFQGKYGILILIASALKETASEGFPRSAGKAWSRSIQLHDITRSGHTKQDRCGWSFDVEKHMPQEQYCAARLCLENEQRDLAFKGVDMKDRPPPLGHLTLNLYVQPTCCTRGVGIWSWHGLYYVPDSPHEQPYWSCPWMDVKQDWIERHKHGRCDALVASPPA